MLHDIMTQSYCENSPGSRDECRTAPDGYRPLDQAEFWPVRGNPGKEKKWERERKITENMAEVIIIIKPKFL